jgi:DNA-binding CsgD family transcriptional regulator
MGISAPLFQAFYWAITGTTSLTRSICRRAVNEKYCNWIAEGKTNKEIATRLNLSVYPVDSHRGKVMYKLNLYSTGELVRFAVRHGLVD